MQFPHGLTIAIPNWNHELLLPRAIRSGLQAVAALREVGVPAEVLVVDDHSRDGSVRMLRQLEARYYRDGLRVQAFNTNAGLSANRNQALALSRYRYIAFVDADNEIVPENIPLFVDGLQKTGAAGAYGTVLLRSVTSEIAYHAFSNEPFQDQMFECNHIDALAVFDRSQLIDEGGYMDQRWEDYEVWLHLATSGRQILFIPVVLGYYYILPSSISTDPAENKNINAVHARMKRIFNQVKAREHLPLNSRHRRYHPSLGYF